MKVSTASSYYASLCEAGATAIQVPDGNNKAPQIQRVVLNWTANTSSVETVYSGPAEALLARQLSIASSSRALPWPPVVCKPSRSRWRPSLDTSNHGAQRMHPEVRDRYASDRWGTLLAISYAGGVEGSSRPSKRRPSGGLEGRAKRLRLGSAIGYGCQITRRA